MIDFLVKKWGKIEVFISCFTVPSLLRLCENEALTSITISENSWVKLYSYLSKPSRKKCSFCFF